jgi:hypothetical protein
VGVGFVTLKMFDFDAVPPPGVGFVTETALAPSEALALTVIWAVSEAELATDTDVTVIPSPKDTVVRPLWNPVPWRVTTSGCPRLPVEGDALKSVGVGFGAVWTSKALERVAVPLGLVTDTSLNPVDAPAAIVILAVICVDELTVVEFTVMPEPKLTEVEPLMNWVPVTVTLRVVPRWEDEGEMPVRVGTANGCPAVQLYRLFTPVVVIVCAALLTVPPWLPQDDPPSIDS